MTAFNKAWEVLKRVVPTSPDDPMGTKLIDSMFCQQCGMGMSPNMSECEKCNAPNPSFNARNIMQDGTPHSPGQQSMIDRATEALRAQKREGQ